MVDSIDMIQIENIWKETLSYQFLTLGVSHLMIGGKTSLRIHLDQI